MKRQNNKYSFDGSSFEAVVAHDGVGKISTVRVVEKGRYTGINFIDLTELPTGTSIGIFASKLKPEYYNGVMDELKFLH